MSENKEKEYDKLADAIVKKNAEYHNRIGSYGCIALGIALLIIGIVLAVVLVGSIMCYLFIGLGAISLIAGIA